MIIANGTIQFKRVVGEGYDENGYPLPPSEEWTEAKPAQILPASYDALAVSTTTDSAYTLAKYEVLIEERDFAKSDEVKLANSDLQATAIHRVVSSEYLRAVRQYKLLCR